MGIEPTVPLKATALQAAWRTTARPKANPRRRGSSTSGSRTHIPQGLSSGALPVGVSCRISIASKPEPPVGIEPTLRPYQGRKLPLHHRGRANSERGVRNPESIPFRVFIPNSAFRTPHSKERAPSGSRTHTSALARRQAAATSWARSQPTEHPAGLAPATPPWEGGMFSATPRTHNNSGSGSGGNRTHVVLLKRQALEPASATLPLASCTGLEPVSPARQAGRHTRFVTGRSSPTAGRGGIEPHGHTATGLGNRLRSQTQSPPVNPVPRAGFEPDLCGLKDRRPHQRSNEA